MEHPRLNTGGKIKLRLNKMGLSLHYDIKY